MEISDEVGLLGYFCNPTLKLGYWVTFVGLLTRLKLGYWVTKVGLLTPMLGYFGTKLQYRGDAVVFVDSEKGDSVRKYYKH